MLFKVAEQYSLAKPFSLNLCAAALKKISTATMDE